MIVLIIYINLLHLSLKKKKSIFEEYGAFKYVWMNVQDNNYSKSPKILNTLFYGFFLSYILLSILLFLKIPSGIANHVNPDQTALSRAEGAV